MSGTSEQPKVFFPGLNGLRFFAAMAVVFTHVELMKKFLGHASHWIDINERVRTFPYDQVITKELSWLSPTIANAGPLGVVFFFVLSGFLITYLLLTEKTTNGFIAIRKFYLRRILRIWPLYYLVFFLGFVVLMNIPWFDVSVQRRGTEPYYWENFFLYLFMLPNLAFSLFMAVPNIGQLWSIGVEEQFYLIWPWIIRKAKSVVKTIIWFMVIFLMIKLVVLLADHFWSNPALRAIRKFFAMSKLECMAFGALGAWIIHERKTRILKWVYHPTIQVLSYFLIPVCIFFTPIILQNYIHLAYSLFFLIVILNVATNENSILKLNHRIFDFLGRISYGIYMYHIMVVVFVLHAMESFWDLQMDLSKVQNLTVYCASTVLVIGVSALSYYVFERPFVRLKRKVTTVVSGDEARKY